MLSILMLSDNHYNYTTEFEKGPLILNKINNKFDIYIIYMCVYLVTRQFAKCFNILDSSILASL